MHRFFAFFYDFRVPLGVVLGSRGANSGSIFVKFRGGAPGSFLDAFWLPFGRLLGAFWEPWGHFWETLDQFGQPCRQLCRRLLGCGRCELIWEGPGGFLDSLWQDF